MSHSITKFFFLLGTLLCLHWDAQATNLILDDFEDPVVSSGCTLAPFSGGNWIYEDTTIKARNYPAQSDFPSPGAAYNQGYQFEWDGRYLRYDLDHAWGAGNTYILSFNSSEMNWGNASDRAINPSIKEQNGTVLWTLTQELPQYSGGGSAWTADQTFSYVVPASSFTTGTPGTNIRVEFETGGSGFSRGVYFDNVDFSEGTAPAGNTPPSPDPMTFTFSPAAVDHQHVYMKATYAFDSYIGEGEYIFENYTTGTNSGWQSDRVWTQANLNTNTLYQFRVKARDLSSNQNETAWSALSNITIAPYSGDGIFLVGGNYQVPSDYVNGEQNFSFVGWGDTNQTRVRYGNADGAPESNSNRLIQFEQTASYITYDMTKTWSTADSYQLNINVSPQSWSGATQRYFTALLEQQDGTDLWTETAAVPLYNSFQGNPWGTDQTYSFSISGASFLGGSPGQPLRLTIKGSNSGGRGIFIDNVVFRQVFAKGTVIRIE